MSSTSNQLHFVFIPSLDQGPMIDMAKLFAENGMMVSLVTNSHWPPQFQSTIHQAKGSGLQIQLLEIPSQGFDIPGIGQILLNKLREHMPLPPPPPPPPGFRFCPSDAELIHYVQKKIDDPRLTFEHIKEIDFYEDNPEQLALQYEGTETADGRKEWYFITPRKTKRKAGDGHWKTTIKTIDVICQGTVGQKAGQVAFYKGTTNKTNRPIRTSWKMDEYTMPRDEWALCRLYISAPKTQSVPPPVVQPTDMLTNLSPSESLCKPLDNPPIGTHLMPDNSHPTYSVMSKPHNQLPIPSPADPSTSLYNWQVLQVDHPTTSTRNIFEPNSGGEETGDFYWQEPIDKYSEELQYNNYFEDTPPAVQPTDMITNFSPSESLSKPLDNPPIATHLMPDSSHPTYSVMSNPHNQLPIPSPSDPSASLYNWQVPQVDHPTTSKHVHHRTPNIFEPNSRGEETSDFYWQEPIDKYYEVLEYTNYFDDASQNLPENLMELRFNFEDGMIPHPTNL
ncbi:uncharacterized protein LOC132294858 [Cornus florida]|uniref:uncharacterized protein LOC132294858 n=1 Tax=Cornus florida TaxID=4283 RepID=UPI002897C628|nr:uncharacterized protein LOC132294858 [Cornus florida]